MKNFMFVALLISAHSFADTTIVEFDHAQEVSCHTEIVKLGCATMTGDEDQNCIEGKKAKLSETCRSIYSIKKKSK